MTTFRFKSPCIGFIKKPASGGFFVAEHILPVLYAFAYIADI